MSHLEIAGRRHPIPVGQLTIGSDAAAQIVVARSGVAPRHAVVQGQPDGQASIRLGDPGAEVLVNGVRLGPQPVPLLHGDKVEIAGIELLFVDERRSGSTQYVQAVDPAMMAAAKPSGRRAPTAGTGGRLVSMTDGREYEVTSASLIIGRDASCDVVLTSKNVSRRHAEVMASPKGYLLVDSSTNGTFVNGERVKGQHLLARGDVIRCGEHEFRFYADVAPEPAPNVPPPATAAPPAPPPVPPAAAVQARAAPPASAPPAAPGAPPVGAQQRLTNTAFGLPGVPRPAAAPRPKVEVSPAPSAPAPQPAVRPTPAPPAPAATGAARPVPGVLANLVVRGGPLKGQRFPIRVPIVNVGRAEYNDIVLPDDSVSTTHAKLQRREGIWVLVDLDSTNGTLVDGERVRGEVPLAPGALVRFGEVQTIFEPTDDTVDAQKGSSTKLMSAVRLPEPPPKKPDSR